MGADRIRETNETIIMNSRPTLDTQPLQASRLQQAVLKRAFEGRLV